MDFVTNIEEIRKRACRHIEEGPVTQRVCWTGSRLSEC
jgi:hypothetical protein